MFITFEGGEGSGKSTAIQAVARRLESEGKAVLTTREPGAGAFGARIRALLLEQGAVGPRSELFLFLADRAAHVAEIIRPALEAGTIVLCDRFIDSTVAYQAFGRKLDRGFITEANQFATAGLLPDLTLFLNLDPAAGLARLQDRDRLDREPLAFHQAVHQGFHELAAAEPHRFVTVDASLTPDAVVSICVNEILSRLK